MSDNGEPDDGFLTILKRVFSADQDQILPSQPAEVEEIESDPQPVKPVKAETALEPEPERRPPAPQPSTISPTSESRRRVSSVEIQEMILNALMAIPNAPKGMTVTVYGYNPWNAMVTVAPGSANGATVRTIRGLLDRIVEESRNKIQIDIPKD